SRATDDYFAWWDRVTAGYFEVIGNPIIRGRGISEEDTSASRNVAVINEAFARKFFKDEDPIGKHFGREPGASRQFEVVGVASTSRIRAEQSGLAFPASHCHSCRARTWPAHPAGTRSHAFGRLQYADPCDSHLEIASCRPVQPAA